MEWRVVVLVVCGLMSGGHTLENVALNKPAQQSGTFPPYTADRAVDGNYRQNMGDGGCAHPSSGRDCVLPQDRNQPAWWRVDLGQEYDVYQVKIYNRIGCCQEWLSNSLILVSNEQRPNITSSTICNEIINGAKDVVTKRCNYNNQKYKRGRYVMIRNHFWGSMNLCEVEVYSCPAGTWGLNVPDGLPDCSDDWGMSCDQECHCAGAASCDVITGSCGAAGCEPGWGGNETCSEKISLATPSPSAGPGNELTGRDIGLYAGLGVMAATNMALLVVILVCFSKIRPRPEVVTQTTSSSRTELRMSEECATSGSWGFSSLYDTQELQEVQE